MSFSYNLGYITTNDDLIDLSKQNGDTFKTNAINKTETSSSQINTEALCIETAFKNMLNIQKESIGKNTIIERKSAKEKVNEFRNAFKDIKEKLEFSKNPSKLATDKATKDLMEIYSIHKELSMLKSTPYENLKLNDRVRLNTLGVFANTVLADKIMEYTCADSNKGKKKLVLEQDLQKNNSQNTDSQINNMVSNVEKLLIELEGIVGKKSTQNLPDFLLDDMDICSCCDKMEYHLSNLQKDEGFDNFDSMCGKIKEQFEKIDKDFIQKNSMEKNAPDYSLYESAHELYNQARNTDKYQGMVGDVIKFYEGIQKCDKEIENFSNEISSYKEKSDDVKKISDECSTDLQSVRDLMAKSFTDIEKKMLALEQKLTKL